MSDAQGLGTDPRLRVLSQTMVAGQDGVPWAPVSALLTTLEVLAAQLDPGGVRHAPPPADPVVHPPSVGPVEVAGVLRDLVDQVVHTSLIRFGPVRAVPDRG